ncbi:hypothetical protein K435DRAFT_691755, partial [Dendrothele bispora CBS 962.96]
MVSGLVSWRATGIPYWKYFFAKWVPGAILPDCDVLSGRILNEEVVKANSETRGQTRGKFGTGQCDGWKNVAKKSLITSMVNVEYQPHLLNVTDISSKPKTADTLLDIVLKEIEHVQNVLMVFLVAWCTDCSGESAKMRRLLRGVFPWIIVLDCWVHQFNLVVGDVLKLKLPLIKVVDRALETIKWFLSHSIAVGLLNEQQKKADFPVILMLILPVLTRWTTHYLALDRLLTLKEPLRQLVLSSPFRSTLELFALAAKVFKRFYNKSPDGIFRKAFSEYLAHAGMWSDERMSLEYFSNDARERNTFVDVVSIWREKLMSENLNDVDGANGLVVLAMRIMSMVPNSASTERIFSRFGAVHTKARNRMSAEKTRKIVVLRTHIDRKH